MDRITDTIDVAALTERFKPLAHQAWDGLRRAAEALIAALDRARRPIDDGGGSAAPVAPMDRPTRLALMASRLPRGQRAWLARSGRSPIQWLLIAGVVALIATLSAVAMAVIVRQLRRSGAQGSVAQGVDQAVEPIIITIAGSTGDDAGEVVAEAVLEEEQAIEASESLSVADTPA